MKKNTGLRAFVSNIYGFSFFNSLMVMLPVYAIFMQEHGVSDMQLSTLFMLYSLGVIAFQLPAAWQNSLFGYKKSILIGQVFKIAGVVSLFVMPNYLGFAAAMLLWGAQGAIYNVSYEALLYDELKARRHRDVYAKVLGRRKALSTVGIALSAAGSLLLFLGYNFIAVATIISVLIGTAFILRIDVRAKKPAAQSNKKRIGFIRLIKAGFAITVKMPCILYLLLVSAMLVNFSYVDDFFSVIALDIGLRKEFVGLVPFFIMCCQVIGQTIAHKFKRMKDYVLYGLISVAGLIFVAFSGFYSVPGLLLFGLAYMLFSILNVLIYAKFQDFVPTAHRPIALSLYSMVSNLLYIGILFVFGLGSMLGGWRYSILLVGMLSVLLGMWVILFVKDKCTPAQMPFKTKMQRIPVANTASVSPSQF